MGNIDTVLGLFLMLLIGYGAKKINLLKEDNATILNKIIINITLPAFVLINLLGRPIIKSMFATPIVFYVVAIITIIITLIICKIFKFSPELTLAICATSAFANTGFMGYPIIGALFESNIQALPTAVIIDQFGMQLLLYIAVPVLASFLIKNSNEKFSFKKFLNIFKSPVLIASILGIIFHKYTLPTFLDQTLSYLAAVTVPLIMISIGLKIHPSETPKYVLPAIIVIILKMLLQPILMRYGVSLAVKEQFIIDIATIQIGLSPAMVTSILVDNYKGDTHFTCAAIFVCTVLTLITVPFTAYLLEI